MGNLILAAILLGYLPAELFSIQVIVPETERSTTLFASVILRCDYSTSANPSEVLVKWVYKSFCKDPVLDYYSTGYQAALQLGQDPTNDCPDSQRTIRTVIQKRGLNEPTLASEYQERRITIRNKADLVITEVMWWDNGVYFCTIDAPGDTSGDSDREVKLVVYHWLTVLLIIMGAVLLLMLFCICCCQCCPHKCCCYVRCPCCPKTCCCPEKVVMQHRMLKEAGKAMAPWMHGQPIYAPVYSDGSMQGQPLLYSGSFSDQPSKQNFAMAPMALQQQPPPPHHGFYGNGPMHGSVHGHNQMLDFLENQVRGMDAGAPPVPPHNAQYMPQMQPQMQPPPQRQRTPQAVPYTPGPPSMLSALDEIGVRGTERRVITLPPIVQRAPSFSLRRGPGGGGGEEGARGGPRPSRQSSGSSNRTGAGGGGGGGGRHRDDRGYRASSLPRRGILRGNSDDSDWESRRRGDVHGGGARDDRGRSAGRRQGGSKPRSYSRDDLKEELRRSAARRDASYSPPLHRRGSWSSDEDDSWRGKGGKGKDWPEKPPSYSSIENQPGRHSGRRNYDRLSDRSSRSATSVVI